MPRGRARRLLVAAACGAWLLGASLERPELDEKEVEAHIESLRTAARDEFHAKQARALAVSHRLERGASELCGREVGPLFGAMVARRLDLVRVSTKVDDTEDALGVGDAVKVLAVLEGAPADVAGVRVGDLVRAVDGRRTKKATDVFAALRDSKEGPIRLELERAGEDVIASLPRVEGCNHGVFVMVDSEADTWSHKNRHDVVVSTGLVRWVRDDDELAIVIAHQIAHQLLGNPMPSRGSEEPPADRLGLFLAARAGFDFAKGPALWDRLAAEEPWRVHSDLKAFSGRYRLGHTAMALRAPVIREAVADIRRQLEAGAAVAP